MPQQPKCVVLKVDRHPDNPGGEQDRRVPTALLPLRLSTLAQPQDLLHCQSLSVGVSLRRRICTCSWTPSITSPLTLLCLPWKPQAEYPFTAFVAMLATLFMQWSTRPCSPCTIRKGAAATLPPNALSPTTRGRRMACTCTATNTGTGKM